MPVMEIIVAPPLIMDRFYPSNPDRPYRRLWCDSVFMDIQPLTPIQFQIVKEISRAFERLGAEVGVFSALHSWGDTMPEDQVLKMLKEQNDAMLEEHHHSISTST